MWEACIFPVTFNCINMEFILAFAATANEPYVEESRCLDCILLQSIIQMSIYVSVSNYMERRVASPIRKHSWKLIVLLLFANEIFKADIRWIFLLKVLFPVWSGGVGWKDSWHVLSLLTGPCVCYINSNHSHPTHTHTPLKCGRAPWML